MKRQERAELVLSYLEKITNYQGVLTDEVLAELLPIEPIRTGWRCPQEICRQAEGGICHPWCPDRVEREKASEGLWITPTRQNRVLTDQERNEEAKTWKRL